MAKTSRPAEPLRSPENSLSDAPIACHELDRDGNIVWVNAAECRLLGLTEGELLGHHVSELVAPAEQEACRSAVARKLAGEQPLVPFECAYRRSDGSYVFLEIHENYRRDKNGRLIGIRSFLLDITERRRAEEALRKVQQALESGIQDRTPELELAKQFLRRELEEERPAEQEQPNIDQVPAAAKSAADLTQQMPAYSGGGQLVVAPLDLSQLVGDSARLLEAIVCETSPSTSLWQAI